MRSLLGPHLLPLAMLLLFGVNTRCVGTREEQVEAGLALPLDLISQGVQSSFLPTPVSLCEGLNVTPVALLQISLLDITLFAKLRVELRVAVHA